MGRQLLNKKKDPKILLVKMEKSINKTTLLYYNNAILSPITYFLGQMDILNPPFCRFSFHKLLATFSYKSRGQF